MKDWPADDLRLFLSETKWIETERARAQKILDARGTRRLAA
jgi:hypothetical protein